MSLMLGRATTGHRRCSLTRPHLRATAARLDHARVRIRRSPQVLAHAYRAGAARRRLAVVLFATLCRFCAVYLVLCHACEMAALACLGTSRGSAGSRRQGLGPVLLAV